MNSLPAGIYLFLSGLMGLGLMRGRNRSLIFLLLLSFNASAALYDRGNGLIYDDVLDITWLQDANYSQTSGFDADGRMGWNAANTWTSQLQYAETGVR